MTAGMREQLIVDLDRRRHGRGEVSSDAVRLTSPTCGDEISVDIRLEGSSIDSLTWAGHGCTVSMASASALAALVPGLAREEFAALRSAFAAAVIGPVPHDDDLADDAPLGDAAAFAGIGRLPLRARCATLAWDAAARALLL